MSAQTTTVNHLQHRAADLSERTLNIGTGGLNQTNIDSGHRDSQQNSQTQGVSGLQSLFFKGDMKFGGLGGVATSVFTTDSLCHSSTSKSAVARVISGQQLSAQVEGNR